MSEKNITIQGREIELAIDTNEHPCFRLGFVADGYAFYENPGDEILVMDLKNNELLEESDGLNLYYKTIREIVNEGKFYEYGESFVRSIGWRFVLPEGPKAFFSKQRKVEEVVKLNNIKRASQIIRKSTFSETEKDIKEHALRFSLNSKESFGDYISEVSKIIISFLNSPEGQELIKELLQEKIIENPYMTLEDENGLKNEMLKDIVAVVVDDVPEIREVLSAYRYSKFNEMAEIRNSYSKSTIDDLIDDVKFRKNTVPVSRGEKEKVNTNVR